jgi:hypothetical protein
VPEGIMKKSPYFVWTYLVQVLYQPILSAVKASVLVFMLRLGGTKRSMRWACWILLVINVLMMFSLTIAAIFQCYPVQKFWDRTATPGSCMKMNIFMMMSSALNIITDLAALCLPFIMFLGLRMQRRVRFVLLGVFSLGVT